MPELDLENRTIHFRDLGSGEQLLMLVHGGLCNGDDWRRLEPLLTDEFRVIIPDLRCHGQSSGDPASADIAAHGADINALRQHLGSHTDILIGHSLGTRVVVEAAASDPSGLAGLILLEGSRTHGGLSATKPVDSDAPPPLQRSLEEMLNLTIGPYLDDAARARVLQVMGSASPELIEATTGAMMAWDMERADSAFAALPNDLPMLAIQSTYHDQHTPRRSLIGPDDSSPYLDFLRSTLKQLAVSVIPDAGHFLMLEHPREVAAQIERFARMIGEESIWPRSD